VLVTVTAFLPAPQARCSVLANAVTERRSITGFFAATSRAVTLTSLARRLVEVLEAIRSLFLTAKTRFAVLSNAENSLRFVVAAVTVPSRTATVTVRLVLIVASPSSLLLLLRLPIAGVLIVVLITVPAMMDTAQAGLPIFPDTVCRLLRRTV